MKLVKFREKNSKDNEVVTFWLPNPTFYDIEGLTGIAIKDPVDGSILPKSYDVAVVDDNDEELVNGLGDKRFNIGKYVKSECKIVGGWGYKKFTTYAQIRGIVAHDDHWCYIADGVTPYKKNLFEGWFIPVNDEHTEIIEDFYSFFETEIKEKVGK